MTRSSTHGHAVAEQEKTDMFDANDRRFMRKALDLARKGLGLASPNPSVGCVIVRDGTIVGRGWHEYFRLDHAEVRALQEASDRARNATAYVTLEPCCHFGRTPPCANRLIEAGIRRVVVGSIDPNPRVSGHGIEMLRSAGIEVDAGLMAEEAGRIIEAFACRITTGLPLVLSKAGMSLDGKIGTAGREDRRITSPESRDFAQTLRLEADALLVGVGTVLADDPVLTYRGKGPKGRALARVILDSRLKTPVAAKVLDTASEAPVIIFCGVEAPEEIRAALQRRGAEVVPVDSSNEEVDLNAVLRNLGERQISGLLVEGGSQVHWSFLSKRLVDKFYFIIAPLILGGDNAVPSVGGAGYNSAAESPRFKIRKSFYVGPDIVLETYPSYSRSIISPWISPGTTPFAAQDSSPSSDPK